jgi:hypothetical protein
MNSLASDARARVEIVAVHRTDGFPGSRDFPSETSRWGFGQTYFKRVSLEKIRRLPGFRRSEMMHGYLINFPASGITAQA